MFTLTKIYLAWWYWNFRTQLESFVKYTAPHQYRQILAWIHLPPYLFLEILPIGKLLSNHRTLHLSETDYTIINHKLVKRLKANLCIKIYIVLFLPFSYQIHTKVQCPATLSSEVLAHKSLYLSNYGTNLLFVFLTIKNLRQAKLWDYANR